MDYAKELGAIFKYTSAKENKGINELFTSIAEKLETMEEEKPESQGGQELKRKPKKTEKGNSGGCC